MNQTYDPAVRPLTYGSAPVRARYRFPERDLSPRLEETVEIYAGDQVYGLLILPRDVAHELISRLQDAPAGLPTGQRAAAGHVRYALDRDYTNEADDPGDWILSLIVLIQQASEEERRRLGRIYPAYVVAVAISSGRDGLEQLRHFHEHLPPDDVDPARRG